MGTDARLRACDAGWSCSTDLEIVQSCQDTAAKATSRTSWSKPFIETAETREETAGGVRPGAYESAAAAMRNMILVEAARKRRCRLKCRVLVQRSRDVNMREHERNYRGT